ncbi:Leucine-rich repeat and IQ domain-containing protein 1 [Tupaia chinensis]|uniref:Leucine-rich repeat and IQ domain-containing protein 1 n=1 Tax=Tupaia chinensis TaxID=246437 RepID=L8Y5L8_TUPCH|nr:Leucine-rich repeat and IQ domain-containing protein 1 [Tupaia chinensis]
MEDDDDAKLKEEIEAELDKISISSLEKDEVESESKSETQSDDSDRDLDELPESVLHCINIIKNKSKTVEELILQDLEDTDVLSCSYGAASDNHLHLRIGLATEHKEHPKQLMKILSVIEKEEFMRSKTLCVSPDFVPEPGCQDLPMDEYVLPDDADVNFGYCEVEERCRQSFEAWQDKQKELEDKEKETLKAQRDREEKQFQEEEEKRHCWMKQFEVEKKKLENIQKQEQDKMNDELHKEEKMWKDKFKQHEEFIRSLHLQMEEERTKFKDLQEKEKMRLLELQHNAAIKIQAKYKAFIAYQKYGPIIKEKIESKKRKAQEWKEKEAYIRQREEEKQKRLEEEQRLEDEIKKQKQEKMEMRKKEYEEKKNILRQEIEQLLIKEKLKLRDSSSQQLISSTLKKGEFNVKLFIAEDISKNKGHIVRKLVDENSNKQEDAPLWLVDESNKIQNVDRQPVWKNSVQVQLKESISNQANLTELKLEERNEDLSKRQCSEKLALQETKYENRDKKTELENPILKENVKEQLELQELKSQIQKEETTEHALNENVGQEVHIVTLGHNQEISRVKNNEVQKRAKDNQQKKLDKVEKEEMPVYKGSLYEENNNSFISTEQKPLPLTLENSQHRGENVILQEKESDLKSKEMEENLEVNTLNTGMIFNTTDAMINIEGKTDKQDYGLGRHGPCENLDGYNAKSSLVSKEGNSLIPEIPEIPEKCLDVRAQPENIVTGSVPESALPFSIEEKRLAWMKSFKPWFEILKQNQQKKIVKIKRTVKCPADTMPPLNTLEILRYGPWNTLQQVFLIL